MFKKHYFLMNELPDDGGEGGAGSSNEPNSILAGAGSQQELTPPANTPPEPNQTANYDWLPEKFIVKTSDGLEVDPIESAKKMAASYDGLSKRLGTGDIPPKDAESYTVDFGEKALMSFDEFKAEPENQEFLKQAHELGMTEKQVQFVLGQYMERLPEIIQAGKDATLEAAQSALNEVWKSEAEFTRNLQGAYKAFQHYASPEDKQLIDQIGNNPLVIKLLANIGKDLQEDDGIAKPQGINPDDAKALMRGEAYRNPNHPDHKAVHARVREFYEKNYGTQPMGG